MIYRLHLDTNPIYWLEFIIAILVLSISFISVSFVNTHYWEISCLLGQTWDYSSICQYVLLFCLRAWALLFLLLFNFFSSYLLSLQFLSKLIIYSYYCSIWPSWCSNFISFHQIALFISCLSSSTNSFFLYLLSFTTLLNSYIDSFIILFSCFSFFNSAILITFLSPPPNFFLQYVKNFSAV